jgi:signal transduction histidine kinase/PAS domain-containing protein
VPKVRPTALRRSASAATILSVETVSSELPGRGLSEGSDVLVPGETQARIRRLLNDPTAELLIWCGEPVWAYTDVDGRRRDPGEAGRAVLPLELRGRPLGAIVHDDAVLSQPELLAQVAAAVGLELERDRMLFLLQASERRSRALLDAVPDKMFRIREDGVILDLQDNPGASMPPSRLGAGSSVYDSPVSREVVDRVMATGRRALETGELQTTEWEVELEGERCYLEGRFVPSGRNEFLAVIRDVGDRRHQEVERAALHRVALAVAGETSAEHLFDLVAAEVGAVLRAHAVRLVRYEPGGESALIVGSWHEPGALDQPLGRYALKGTASEAVYKTGRPVRRELDDPVVTPELAAIMRKLEVHSLVAAPIKVAGAPWGAVVATLNAPHSFPPGAEGRLGEFTQLVSLALANEESRAQLAASRARLVSMADEERRRLERNLHDGAQQRLVSLSLLLRQIRDRIGSAPDSLDELVSAASTELAVALDELRELARGIHPAILTQRGLGPALQSLADRSPVPVELDLPAAGRISQPVEAAAYYLVSEALANVAKYANASCVAVSVSRANGTAVVEIADDGVGGADPQNGSGLRGLTDRIEALEGSLAVFSRRGEGTRIRAEIPCG